MLITIVGIVILLALAVLLSSDRKGINLRVVGSAFLLQLAIAIFVLVVPFGKDVLTRIRRIWALFSWCRYCRSLSLPRP